MDSTELSGEMLDPITRPVPGSRLTWRKLFTLPQDHPITRTGFLGKRSITATAAVNTQFVAVHWDSNGHNTNQSAPLAWSAVVPGDLTDVELCVPCPLHEATRFLPDLTSNGWVVYLADAPDMATYVSFSPACTFKT